MTNNSTHYVIFDNMHGEWVYVARGGESWTVNWWGTEPNLQDERVDRFETLEEAQATLEEICNLRGITISKQYFDIYSITIKKEAKE